MNTNNTKNKGKKKDFYEEPTFKGIFDPIMTSPKLFTREEVLEIIGDDYKMTHKKDECVICRSNMLGNLLKAEQRARLEEIK